MSEKLGLAILVTGGVGFRFFPFVHGFRCRFEQTHLILLGFVNATIYCRVEN